MPDYTTGRATPIKNRNFLAPVGFKFTLDRAKSVSFFCNQANIPDITLGVAEQPTWLKDIPVPGDKIQFIDGDVFCSDADISGSVKGKITVSQLLSLKASAKLDGDIVTNKLAIEPGCSFSGSCSMGAVIKDIKHVEKQQKEQGNQEKTA